MAAEVHRLRIHLLHTVGTFDLSAAFAVEPARQLDRVEWMTIISCRWRAWTHRRWLWRLIDPGSRAGVEHVCALVSLKLL
jgi:hypothetical protein